MVELLYCTRHERLYDATEHRWIPFSRGEVRLVQTIYPKRGDLHVRHNICDVCVRVSQRCFIPLLSHWDKPLEVVHHGD